MNWILNKDINKFSYFEHDHPVHNEADVFLNFNSIPVIIYYIRSYLLNVKCQIKKKWAEYEYDLIAYSALRT